MKVVLDTNIFISGIHWPGPSGKVLISWFDDLFELVSSEEIVEEITRVLMNFKVPLSTTTINLWKNIILEKSIIVKPTEIISIVKEDPGDNKIIEAAVAGNANYIISIDKHLLKLKEFRNIKIIKPEDFLKVL